MIKVQNLYNAKITRLSNNCTLIQTEDLEILISYSSIICVKENNKIILGKDWNYSRTTSKYLNKYLNTSTKEIKDKISTGEYVVDTLL